MNRTTAVRRAGTLLATLVLLAAVAPFVVFAVPQVVGADDSFVVLSGSMEPALSPGDVVIVDASVPVRVGDVITYTTGDGDGVPTTHRVVDERDGGYETKGDANENADAGMVPTESVLGRVVFVIPFIGHVVLWANTSAGYVALVVVPLVLLGVSELVAWVRREPDEETNADESAALIPAIRRVADDTESADEVGEPTADRTVEIAAVDLKLTLLAMGSLSAYAGWNVYREFVGGGAPDPVSVGALTAGLLGLLFAGSVTVAAWRTNRAAKSVSAASTAARTGRLTDGGADVESGDE